MKILQINTWYDYGSTGKIVADIHNFLKENGVESFVLYGRGNKTDDPNVIKCCTTLEAKANSVLSRFSGIQYGGNYFSTKKFIKEIKRINPDVIHIHCPNSFVINIYKLLDFLGRFGKKIIITLHAEFFYTGLCSYSFDCNQFKTKCLKCPVKYRRNIFGDSAKKSWALMNDAFSKLNKNNTNIIGVSEWVSDRARQSKILCNFNIKTILNGTDTNSYNFKNKISKNREILYVTPNFSNRTHDIKGGYFFEKILNDPDYSDFVFKVVGKNRNNYNFSIYKNCEYLGEILSKDRMSEIYSHADATLLLSKRETYSMVTAESLCCGTQVIGFLAGAPETIAIPQYSKFVEYGDLKQLKKEIFSLKKYNTDEKYEISKKAVSKYKKEKMLNEYLELYK